MRLWNFHIGNLAILSNKHRKKSVVLLFFSFFFWLLTFILLYALLHYNIPINPGFLLHFISWCFFFWMLLVRSIKYFWLLHLLFLFPHIFHFVQLCSILQQVEGKHLEVFLPNFKIKFIDFLVEELVLWEIAFEIVF